MSDIAIRAEGLSKLYRIGERERYYTLRESLTRGLAAPFRRFHRNGDGTQPAGKDTLDLQPPVPGPSAVPRPLASVNGPGSTIWALKNVSFEVKQGEVIGIIGRNGAGKSTLLKILSRITEPTEGYAEIHGRVGSLLEVGTGFHPELTGRENIYLNGAILGMKKVEINRKFDEIVAFAEVDKFLDTPVKHYSSGMYMRLAFAVAAYLEPEILLVDEVLAVGDAAFQKRCLGRMGAVAREGRTVLFVSHNMAAIEHLCQRVIVFEDGRIRANAAPRKAIAEYLVSFSTPFEENGLGALRRDPGLLPVIQRVDFIDRHGRFVDVVPACAPLTVNIHYKNTGPIKDPFFGIVFETNTGTRVFWVQTRLQKGSLPDLPPTGLIACHIPRLPLIPGTYFVQPGCGSGQTQLDVIPRACQLRVTETDMFGTGRFPSSSLGLVIVDAEWEVLRE